MAKDIIQIKELKEAYMKLARVDYKKLMKSAGRNPSTFYRRRDGSGMMTVSDLREFIIFRKKKF